MIQTYECPPQGVAGVIPPLSRVTPLKDPSDQPEGEPVPMGTPNESAQPEKLERLGRKLESKKAKVCGPKVVRVEEPENIPRPWSRLNAVDRVRIADYRCRRRGANSGTQGSGSVSAVRHAIQGRLAATNHCLKRLQNRGIRNWQLEAVLEHGRAIYVRGACILAIGAKEVVRAMKNGVDLRGCEGIQVVTSLSDGAVVTAYRNCDFRGLKSRKHRSNRSR